VGHLERRDRCRERWRWSWRAITVLGSNRLSRLNGFSQRVDCLTWMSKKGIAGYHIPAFYGNQLNTV